MLRLLQPNASVELMRPKQLKRDGGVLFNMLCRSWLCQVCLEDPFRVLCTRHLRLVPDSTDRQVRLVNAQLGFVLLWEALFNARPALHTFFVTTYVPKPAP